MSKQERKRRDGSMGGVGGGGSSLVKTLHVQGPQDDPQYHQTPRQSRRGKWVAYSAPTNEIHKQDKVVQCCMPSLGRQRQVEQEFTFEASMGCRDL